MNIDKNNPQITAYALGELEASESGVVEEALRASGAYDEVIDELRELEGLLTDSLAVEEAAAPDLGEGRRTVLEKRLDTIRGLRERRHDRIPMWRRLGVWLPFVLILIVILLAIYMGHAIIQTMESPPGSPPEPTPVNPTQNSDPGQPVS